MLGRFSTGEITRLLRALVREGISIRDLRTILERLLQFDIIPLDSWPYIVLDDRLTVPEETPPALVNRWPNHVAFVRKGLRRYISHKFAQFQDTLGAYLVEHELEGEILALTRDSEPSKTEGGALDDRREAIREAVWAQVGGLDPAVPKPPLLTATESRAALWEMLAPEMPDLPVLAYSELRPDLSISTLGRVAVG